MCVQAAAALLFHKLITHGAQVDVKPEEATRAALDGFTDLTQICVRCPLQHGILDGIVLSLYHLLVEVCSWVKVSVCVISDVRLSEGCRLCDTVIFVLHQKFLYKFSEIFACVLFYCDFMFQGIILFRFWGTSMAIFLK